MPFWLIKSEPEVFSYTDLQGREREPWNGVRNYQARNFLRQMRVGDLCLFYHSNAAPPGIAGVARVVREAYPDDLQFNPDSPYFDPRSNRFEPRWSMVDVQAAQPFERLLSLDELRALPEWQDSPVTRKGMRLSVFPVTPEQFQAALNAVKLDIHALHLARAQTPVTLL